MTSLALSLKSRLIMIKTKYQFVQSDKIYTKSFGINVRNSWQNFFENELGTPWNVNKQFDVQDRLRLECVERNVYISENDRESFILDRILELNEHQQSVIQTYIENVTKKELIL